MIDERTITLLAERFLGLCSPNNWDFGYGDYDDITPALLEALGDEATEAAVFIESATKPQRLLFLRLHDEIAEKFNSPEVAAALHGIHHTQFEESFFRYSRRRGENYVSVNETGIRKLLDDLDFVSMIAKRKPGLAVLSAGDNDALEEHVLELLGDDADAIIEFIQAADDETRCFINEFGGSIIEAHPSEKMLRCLCDLCEDENERAMLIDYSKEFLCT